MNLGTLIKGPIEDFNHLFKNGIENEEEIFIKIFNFNDIDNQKNKDLNKVNNLESKIQNINKEDQNINFEDVMAIVFA